MGKTIRENYEATYLFPPCVEDWVGEDHLARFVREVVDALDLVALGFEEVGPQEGCGRGRPQYAESILLKVWMYGYLTKVRSTRTLERACLNDVGLIWLTCRNEPDHNTLWRFWKRRRAAIQQVFRQVVKIAAKAKIVDTILHAIDGTKIQSVASNRRRKNLYRKNLRKQNAAIEEILREIEEEIEANRAAEGTANCRLPEKYTDAKRLRATVQEALQELDESGKNQLNPNDPDSQMLPCEGKKKFGYNAQAVVDQQSGLIVAGDVSADANDHRQLIPLLEQTEENVGTVADDTVADKGYRSDENLGKAEEREYPVLVSIYQTEGEEAHPYHSSRFQYDEEHDCCICPMGEKLPLKGQRKSRHGWTDNRYGCEAEHCHCSAGSRKRSVFVGPHHKAVLRQRQRQRDPIEQEKLKKRQSIVEPVFAQIKHNDSFRRWTATGLQNVRTQWAMLCTVYNLKKLYRLWVSGQLELEQV